MNERRPRHEAKLGGRAGGEGPRPPGKEARRQAAPAPCGRCAANRSDQSDTDEEFAHHAGWRAAGVRAVLQRSGGGGKPTAFSWSPRRWFRPPTTKQQIEPMLKRIEGICQPIWGSREDIAGGTNGYFSDAQCGAVRCGTDRSDDCAGPPVPQSSVPWRSALPKQPPAGLRNPTPLAAHEPSSTDARRQEALCPCASRFRNPVFGIIKSVMGFRQFSPAWPLTRSKVSGAFRHDGVEHESGMYAPGGRLKRPGRRAPPFHWARECSLKIASKPHGHTIMNPRPSPSVTILSARTKTNT